jgi:hypothetical protein
MEFGKVPIFQCKHIVCKDALKPFLSKAKLKEPN